MRSVSLLYRDSGVYRSKMSCIFKSDAFEMTVLHTILGTDSINDLWRLRKSPNETNTIQTRRIILKCSRAGGT